MDYARKIGKSDEPKKWAKQRATAVTVRDGLISPDICLLEDRRLVNWRKWLERRKEQYERIKCTTARHQNNQILNACEKVRPLIEMRNLIDYASAPVPVIPDKYRGGPEFWRMPQTLPKRSCLPDIAFTPSKRELNVIPELTYVDLPELIQKEKYIFGLKSKEPLWKRSNYLMKRKKELSKEIELLVPHEPETENLMITNYVPPKREIQPRIPPITISHVEEEEEEESCCNCYPEQVVLLKIQDREIGWRKFAPKNIGAKSDPVTWSLTFSGEINKRSEKKIVFENKGNRVIIYQWRIATFHTSVISLSRQTSPFFFNKMKEVILPGQIINLKIWYLPRSPCVYTEFWKLITSPVLCSSPLIFRFWGCVETSIVQIPRFNSVQMIDAYLDRCIRNSIIREIITGIIENLNFTKDLEPAYGTLFLESEVFTMKNPLCFYEPSLLIEFHKIYYNATNQKEQRWNMSLTDLREILLQLSAPNRRNVMLLQFSMLYKQSLRPTLYNSVQYNKHEVVYNLLCSFFNHFEIESECAKRACFIKEYKRTSGMSSEMSYMVSMDTSQVSIRSHNSQSKQRKKSSIILQNNLLQRATETSILAANDRPYREMFFIRIYELLGEILVRVFAAIESVNNLNDRDK